MKLFLRTLAPRDGNKNFLPPILLATEVLPKDMSGNRYLLQSG